jgi:phosphatidylserine/phosphatidylglycerophosphate/cardiolipin synthase-like enzyme
MKRRLAWVPLTLLLVLAAGAAAKKPAAPKKGPGVRAPLPLKRLMRRYQWVNRTINLTRTEPVRVLTHPSDHLGGEPGPLEHAFYSAAFQRGLDRVTHSRLTAGNALKLLPNGISGREKMQLARNARETLFVTTMVFHCDEGGKKFTQALIDARQRGVDVRLIVDGIMVWASPPCLLNLRRAGVKTVISGRSLIPTKIDWEMHDKMVVADGEVAIVGGQNIGTWYFESDGVDENYRDTDLRVKGPVVRQIARRFVAIWQELKPQDASLESYTASLLDADIKDAAASRLGVDHYDQWLEPKHRRGLCRFVSQDPHKGTFHVFSAYTSLAQNTKKRIVLHALAFDPLGSPQQEALRKAMVELAQDPGGRVDVITNGPGLVDSKMLGKELGLWFGSVSLNAAYQGVENTPIRIWAHRSYMHSKVFYFDGVATAVGSFNFDDSGIRCQESTLICMDPELTEAVEGMFALDFANSVEVSFDPASRLEDGDVQKPAKAEQERAQMD